MKLTIEIPDTIIPRVRAAFGAMDLPADDKRLTDRIVNYLAQTVANVERSVILSAAVKDADILKDFEALPEIGRKP